jgi:hypothetical protein
LFASFWTCDIIYILGSSPLWRDHVDVDLEVNPAEPSHGRVDVVEIVHGVHHHAVSVCLEPVHEREQLEDNVLITYPWVLSLLCTFGHNEVDLVDEDDECFLAVAIGESRILSKDTPLKKFLYTIQ